ncbi:MAG: hypothetical protein ACM3NQ_06680 [Bacteroidales bacterium]
MCRRIVVVLVMVLCLAACSQSAKLPTAPGAALAPIAVLSEARSSAAAVALPFHSDVAWQKVEGSQVELCTVPLPAGKVYLMRNTQTGIAVSTHLGTGQFLGHTCVYGTREKGPEGWFGEVEWTAANGDVLRATSAFVRWTGTPGRSVAVEQVTFRDGGTGRFQFAEGTGTCDVNAPGRTATYEASLRYGKKEK